MKRKNISKFNILLITLFILLVSLFLIMKVEEVEAATPNTVYTKLSSNVTEVMPGEYVDLTFSIHNLESLPAGENGVEVLMFYAYYDSSKFELPIGTVSSDETSIKTDNIVTVSPHFMSNFVIPQNIIIKYKNNNPDFLGIQILFTQVLDNPLTTNGDMFTIKFLAKEDASGGNANFYMTDNLAEGYGIVTTRTNRLEIPVDNSLANINVSVTGEPVSEYTISFDSAGGSNVDNITAIYGDVVSEPIAPTKEGYKFLGWYKDEMLYEFSTMPNHDIHLVAKWKAISYEISYNANGGMGSMSSQSVSYDEVVSLSQNKFTKEGHTFIGWATAQGGSLKYTDGEVVSNLINQDGEITLYAIWEKKAYTLLINSEFLIVKRGSNRLSNGANIYIDDLLNFEYLRDGYSSATIIANGSEILDNEFLVGSENVTLSISNEVLKIYNLNYNLDGGINSTYNPDTFTINTETFSLFDPTKSGYEFVGWYTAVSGGTKVSSINKGTNTDITLYARWLEVYTITLNANGGLLNNNLETSNFNIVHNGQYGSNLVNPEREGYIFVGWYTSLENGTKVVASTRATSSTTLYARWQVKTTTIRFNSNGGSSVANITNSYGSIVNQPINPTRKGYTFLGWYMDNSSFLNKQDFPLTMPENDFTLYAKWEINSYTITFESNGGSQVDDIVLNYNENVTKPIDPTRDGYVFAGWYTDNFTYQNQYSFSKMQDSNITLYAKWNKIYVIEFDYLGGNETVSSKDVIEGSLVGTLPKPTKAGYEFLGWWTEVNGNTIEIKTSTRYDFGMDLVLYAKWQAKKYSISFNSNGGTPVSKIEKFYGDDISKPTDPTKVGYQFVGWYLDNNTFNNKYEFSSQMPNENLVLYAKWEIKSNIKISFEVNGGDAIASLENLTYMESLNLPVPVRMGYKFISWYSDPDLNNLFTSKNVPAEDYILYAKWLEEYTISFVSNSSNQYNDIVKYPNDTFGILPTPSKTGYKFIGWYASPTFEESSKVDNNTIVTKSTTLYAKWEALEYIINYYDDSNLISSDKYLYNQNIIIPSEPTKSGYIFAGWYTSVAGLVEYEFSTMPDHDLNLYAKWVKEDSVNYEIHLHNYDNSGGITTINRYGMDTFSFANYNVAGYTLVGWFTELVGGVEVLASDLVGGAETEINLYARWEIKEVTLFFYSRGSLYLEITQDYNSPITKPIDPTLVGHTFKGWFISNDGINLLDEFDFNLMPADDLNLYAKWEANLYTITFDSMGGNEVSSISKTYGSKDIILPTPIYEGYKFMGWYDFDDNLITSPYTMALDITLYAKWEIIGFADTNLNELFIKDMNGNTIKTINNITKKMHIFVGNEYSEIEIFASPRYSITNINYVSRHNLNVGEEVEVEISLTAQSGKVEIYKLIITRDTLPLLSDIVLDEKIDFVFDGSFTYSLISPINLSNVLVEVLSIDQKNTITINGQVINLVNLGGSRNISLNQAGKDTVVTINVTSLSGEVQNKYVLNIYRSNLPNEARLTNLEVYGNNSHVSELFTLDNNESGFNMDVEDYYMNIPYNDTSLYINPTFASGASAVIEGVDNLEVGLNIVTITVTAADGITTKTYTIEVTRSAPSNIAKIKEVRLKNLDTGEIGYKTELNPSIINVINIPYSFKFGTVLPVASSDSFNSSIIDLGNLNFKEGINDYELTIVAEDGITKTVYDLRIIRKEGNTDNVLNKLNIGNFDLSPNLDLENIFNYSLKSTIPFTTANLLINVEKLSPEYGYITIKYGSNQEVKTKSININPVVGTSVIEIKVYPEKGEVQTYLIEIEKENITGNYELSSLIVKDKRHNQIELFPEFNMFVFNYDLGKLEYKIDKLIIVPSTVIGSSISNFTINGINVSANLGEYSVNLAEGSNQILITVTSDSNPSLENTYEILVIRSSGDNTNTATLNASEGVLDRDGNNYTLTLPKSSTGFILDVFRDSNMSKVIIDGDEVNSKYFDFRTIDNANYIIEVISETGIINEYNLNVKKSIYSNNAELSSLIVTGNNSLQSVNLKTFPASFTLPYVDSSVSFNPKFKDPNSSINILNANLKVGLNQVVVRITAEDGITYKNYILNITREAPSAIANLENIIINNYIDQASQYSLNEIFAFDKFSYSSNVEFGVSKVIINPIPLAGYGITYVIKDSLGNVIGNEVELIQGDNTFTIEVFGEDLTSNTYTLLITREFGDANTSLEFLNITEHDLNYDKDTFVYPKIGYYEYSFEDEFIFINAKTVSKNSKITLQINNEIINFNNELDYRVNLDYGITIIRVIVVAENNEETTYRINLRRNKTSNEIDIFDILVEGLNSKEEYIADLPLQDSLGNEVDFDLNNFYYYLNVDYKYKKVLIKPKYINSIVNPVEKIVDVIPGEIVAVSFQVQSEDLSHILTYTIYVKGELGDSDTLLSSLEVVDNNGNNYLPDFENDKYVYDLEISKSIKYLTFNAFPNSENAKIIIGNKVMNPFESNTINVENAIDVYIWVVAENGDSKPYVVRITKSSKSDNAYLESITLTSNLGNDLMSDLIPSFKYNKFVYQIVVDYSVTEIFVSGVGQDGAKIISGFHITDLKTLPHTNVLEVVTEAIDGSRLTYTFLIFRLLPKQDASLIELEVDGKRIVIEDDVFDYFVDVNFKVDEINLKVYPNSPFAQVKVNYKPYDFDLGFTTNILLGNNIMEIVVLAQDGKTSQTYYLNVNRQSPSNQALIEDLKLIDVNNYKFKERLVDGKYIDTIYRPKENIQYIFVDKSQDSLFLNPLLSNNSRLVDYDIDNILIDLDFGYNIVPLKVVAEDEITENVYFFVIHRDSYSNNTKIENINFNGSDVVLEKINNNIFKVVNNEKTKKLDFEVLLEDKNASYEIIGNHNLKNNDLITILVTAEDGTTIGTYYLSIEMANTSIYLILAAIFLAIIMSVGTTLISMKVIRSRYNRKA